MRYEFVFLKKVTVCNVDLSSGFIFLPGPVDLLVEGHGEGHSQELRKQTGSGGELWSCCSLARRLKVGFGCPTLFHHFLLDSRRRSPQWLDLHKQEKVVLFPAFYTDDPDAFFSETDQIWLRQEKKQPSAISDHS